MISPSTVRYGDGPDQYVEVWEPSVPVLGTAVLIHGGYWRARWALDLMHPMAAHLVDRGWRALNVEYRRVEEGATGGVWPEMASDIRSALSIAADGGVPMVIIGHSAGGQLALWAAADARMEGLALIAGVVALAPVADLVAADERDLSDGAARLLLGASASTDPARYDQASPIARVPLGVSQLVVHGDADDAVPFEISTSYAAAATAAGDPVELLAPTGVDHFHIIDPTHDVWRLIDEHIDSWVSA